MQLQTLIPIKIRQLMDPRECCCLLVSFCVLHSFDILILLVPDYYSELHGISGSGETTGTTRVTTP